MTKRYRKPFERRIHLAKFVTESAARSGSTRFKWQRIAAEFNEANPIEHISPEVLRVEYYRALHDDDVVAQLVMIKALEGSAHKSWNFAVGSWLAAGPTWRTTRRI